MKLGEKTWKEASGLTDKIVIVPTGSQEQHGHHLPLLTDTMIGAEIVRRAEEQLGDEALFLSPLWLGCSPHHLEFPGTVSVSSDTYIRMIEDIAESLIRGGFRRILFINSHAGNVTPISAAISNVNLRNSVKIPDLWLVSSSWFSLAAKAISSLEGFKQIRISHACEWETSQIMATHPQLVKDERPTARFTLFPDEASNFFSADYSGGSRVEVARRIDQNSPTGAFGWPELATVEKGEQLFTVAANELVAFVREFATWPKTITPQVINEPPVASTQTAS
jgi:creatinine amidohydrolase